MTRIQDYYFWFMLGLMLSHSDDVTIYGQGLRIGQPMVNFIKTLLLISIFCVHHFIAKNSIAKESNHKVQTQQDTQLPEKRVTFYTSYGYESGKNWCIPLRIWVSEDMGWTRSLSLKAARKAIKHKADIEELSDAQKGRFRFRAEDFFRDSESNEIISIQFDNDPVKQIFKLVDEQGDLKTDRNGNIEGTLVITKEKAINLLRYQSSSDGWLSFHVVSDNHYGTGSVRLIPATGFSIISDIDDTIKVTEILSGTKTVLQNTFFKSFKAAPNMLQMYRNFPVDTSFHYVSGSPWQLYTGLIDFMFKTDVGFPRGSLHMKNVRTNLAESETYDDISKLIAGGATVKQKLDQIGLILSHFPQREFTLIGDSGEHDPEIFNTIKKRYPKQIKEIRIRDIVNDGKLNPERLKGMLIIAATNFKK